MINNRVPADVLARIGVVAWIRDRETKSDSRERGVRTRIVDQERSDD
jgi:hypothetical protein